MSDNSAVPAGGDRLAKVIARAGLCSRRDAEGWIKDGRVSVNGAPVRTPAFNVAPGDEIRVDGRLLAERTGTRVWLYHKPPGLVVTEKDPEGRETIFDRLEEEGLPRVLTVGRLDINTEGLLLLTNDGGLKRVLELPATGWLRRYRVRAYGHVSQAQLDDLKNGVQIDGVRYGPIEATLEREQGDNVWLQVGLREGKNREVKNVLASLGLTVNRLIRISYGPFQLGDIPVGGVETVRAKVLRDQLGARLAREAGVDFESEMPNRRPAQASAEPAERPPVRHRPGRFEPIRRPPRPAAEAAERPRGRPRKIHFDDGREPVEFVQKSFGAKSRDDAPGAAPRGARPARPAGARPARSGPRPTGEDRPKRTFADGPRRDARPGPRGDAPHRPRTDAADRPKRAFPDRPKRDFGDSPRREFSDRPKRDFPDRPKRDFAERPRRAFPEAPKREFSDRPKRDFADRPKKDFADRPKREFSDRPRSAPTDGPRSPRGPRPQGDRPRSGASAGGRPGADRPRGPRPASGAPRPPRPAGDRPRGPRPEGGAPRKPGGARGPGGPRPPRPSGPGGDRPRGPRKPRP